MNFFESLGAVYLDELRKYLQFKYFPKDHCLMQEGAPADGCYIVKSGELRVELKKIETDSDNVLCHLDPGSIVGEFGLLTDHPRSASVFAHENTEVYWLSKEHFEQIRKENPELTIQILTILGQNLVHKLLQHNRKVAEHIFEAECDAQTDETVCAASSAQKEFAGWSEERVDSLLKDIAKVMTKEAPMLAEMNVADTGIGNISDKILKIQFACESILNFLVGKKGSGFLNEMQNETYEIASPMGVIFAVIPLTNPISTIIFKTMLCLKSRNALIYSCHRDSLNLGNRVGELIKEVLIHHQAPKSLVQWISNRTDRKKTAMFMKHEKTSFILATGGPSIVRAAYSSGTPAIGVGSGNAPVLICEDADLSHAAKSVIQGKSFDNGIICGSENNLVVVRAIAKVFLDQLQMNGAYLLTQEEKEKFIHLICDSEGNHIKREFIGKSADFIGKTLGIEKSPRLLIILSDKKEVKGLLGHEKLAPTLSFFIVEDLEEGFSICKQILEQQGIGHTAVIHTENEKIAKSFAQEMPVSRILVNVPAAQGCIGIGTSLIPSLTLGCGTFAGNSTTDNVTYTHLLNIKRLARKF